MNYGGMIVKNFWILSLALSLITIASAQDANSFWWKTNTDLTPQNGVLEIPLKDINDGQAHHYQVQADDGITVTFFTLKSRDGVIRAAIDSCDVCYRSGKGYFQDGDFMVCQNCGQKFASNKINIIKGGCNPAPLRRQIQGENLIVAMADINANSWYCNYK